MIAFTIACANYLPQATIVADSFRRHHPGAKIFLVVVERHVMSSDLTKCFDAIMPVDAVVPRNLDSFLFKYGTVEACTAIKPWTFLQLLNCFPEEDAVLYLDPDILVTSSFDEVLEGLPGDPILVTPHHLEDRFTLEGVYANVLKVLVCGIFNLGFLAIRPCEESRKFLDWWAKKLETLCYNLPESGLFVDQRWVDLAIGIFPVRILRHPGYNVAHWNIYHRPLARAGGRLMIKDKPLRFIHFSGHARGEDVYFFDHFAKPGCASRQIREEYLAMLDARGRSEWCGHEWSFARFDSGEMIHSANRRIYGRSSQLQMHLPMPFAGSNALLAQHAKNFRATQDGWWRTWDALAAKRHPEEIP